MLRDKKKDRPGRIGLDVIAKELLCDNTCHLEHLVRVTPLVVIPSAYLDEGRIKLDTSLLVEDRGVAVVAEVGRNDCISHGLYTVRGILQARILEWIAFPFSRGSSQPRDGS